jgi:hypothetical protein
MGGGGLMQLVAYGAQDIYLTGNPQITFFKVVYRRHTNFALEAIEQTYTGQADFDRRFTVTVARNGDLLGRVIIEVEFQPVTDTVEDGIVRFGHQLIEYVEVEIGGQIIDKHYGIWMDAWCQLTHTQEQWQKLVRMIDGSLFSTDFSDTRRMYIPLHFWFCRNPGLYLPLIALQYHEVKLNINFNPESEIFTNNGGPIGTNNVYDITIYDVRIYCDYVFLDTDERRRFAQVSHEYLIEQVQYNNGITIPVTGSEVTPSNPQNFQTELRFNHPCKELVWFIWAYNNTLPKAFEYSGFDTSVVGVPTPSNQDNYFDIVQTALLQLNGHDRFKRRDGSYFRCVQTYQWHTGGFLQIPEDLTLGVGPYEGVKQWMAKTGGIYVYSFALKPEDHQPSGTCNFSRIDNAVLNLSVANMPISADNQSYTYTLFVWAINYNVLRIMSGMGGLAYSN